MSPSKMPKDKDNQSTHQYRRWILITGATDGLGQQLAQDLSANVNENFVIVHGRSATKCQKTVDFLNAENGPKLRVNNTTKGPSSNVDFVAADFSKLSEVTRMAEEIRLRFPRLNTFIASASVVVPRRIKSQDGIELTLQINHLAHVVLWNELLPLLEQNSPSRILTVGSMLHNFSIDWTDLNCERSVYDKFAQYSRTKLMNHLATLYIHRLMFKHKKQFQVTANVVDAEKRVEKRSGTPTPAITLAACSTRSHLGTILSASESHLYQHENALDTLVRLTEDREFEGISGKYFDANGKELRLGADVCDVRIQDQLWTESKLLCNGVLGRRTTTTTNIPNKKIVQNSIGSHSSMINNNNSFGH